MSDLSGETLLTLADVCEVVPRRPNGEKLNLSTAYRWTTIGVGGTRLEFIQIGGTRCTTREALARFFAKLTSAAEGRRGDPCAGKGVLRKADTVERC